MRLSVSSADLPAWVSERGRERAADTLRRFRARRAARLRGGPRPRPLLRAAAGCGDAVPGGHVLRVAMLGEPGERPSAPASRPRRRQPEPGAALRPDSGQGFPRSVNFIAGIRALPRRCCELPVMRTGEGVFSEKVETGGDKISVRAVLHL